MRPSNSPAQSDVAERMETGSECPISKMTGDILPTCFLLGIIAGFTAFVAFGQAVLPAIVAAVTGAFLGLFFACEKEPASGNAPVSNELPRAHH